MLLNLYSTCLMENNKINTLNVLKNNLKSFSDNNKNCNY